MIVAAKPFQPQANPLPPGLRQDLPDPWMPWKISDRVFHSLVAPANSPYKKTQVLPTDPEWRFVWRYFYQDKPISYGIKRIHCIHNASLSAIFEAGLIAQERESKTPIFRASWDQEPRAPQRAEAIDRWKTSVEAFSPFKTEDSDGRIHTWTETKVLPLWHGSSAEKVSAISELGYTFFGKVALPGAAAGSTDDGYFGSGIYFTDSARYAADIYSKGNPGNMMLSWVSMREPFPVVGDLAQEDMQTLRGKGAYKQYNAHYVPVVPKLVRVKTPQDLANLAQAPISNDPSCPFYYPCSPGEAPYCAEVVVFQKSQTLPRFWIELCPEHPGVGNLSINPKLVEDLIPHLFKVLEHPEVDTDKKLRTLFAQELSKLLKANLDDDLTVPQETLFGMMKTLLDTAGKINKAARQALIGGGAAPAAAAAANIAPVLAPPVVPQQSSPAIPPVVPVALSPAKAPPVQPVILVPQAPAFQLPALAFGARDWNRYFGDVGARTTLPADINDFLESPCPIFPGKKNRRNPHSCAYSSHSEREASHSGFFGRTNPTSPERRKRNQIRVITWMKLKNKLVRLPAPPRIGY